MSSSTAPTGIARFLKPSLDWLLVFIPIAIALRLMGGSPTFLFITSCLAVVPLAGWMGRATEHLAEKVGEGLGGLLNATFGNAAELIIALVAMQKGLYGVVKASLTGSIIGNILLVLGLSCFMGGMKFTEQRFNLTAARASSTTLLLAAFSLAIPTVFHRVAGDTGHWTPALEQRLSLAIAVVLLISYVAMLLFSLKTHKDLFTGEEHRSESEVDAEYVADQAEEGHEEWSMGKSVGVLVVATAFVAIMSEFLVGSIEQARTALGLTEVFVGVILVAIIGNAAEHSTAVLMAMRNRMELSLGIAISSSIQIALFVAPVLIFASYIFHAFNPHLVPMDLEFTLPEIVAMVVSVIVVGQIAGDGKSNWLEGIQLLAVYAVLGILFFFLPEVHHSASPAH
jgi:Ca2+:H+ antiporter